MNGVMRGFASERINRVLRSAADVFVSGGVVFLAVGPGSSGYLRHRRGGVFRNFPGS